MAVGDGIHRLQPDTDHGIGQRVVAVGKIVGEASRKGKLLEDSEDLLQNMDLGRQDVDDDGCVFSRNRDLRPPRF